MVAKTTKTLMAFNDLVETHVMVAGSGPPVVFLAGAGGLTWDVLLDDLSENFTVYAPYFPGSAGDPDAIRHIHDWWDLVLYHYELFDKLGLRSPAVVGYSFGGMIAAELAATNPERVSKLVLIAAAGLWRDDQPIGDWMGLPIEDIIERTFVDPEGPVAQAEFTMPEDPEELRKKIIYWTWALGCSGKFVWPIPEKGLMRRIHRITAPSLIIWGKQDRLVPPVYAEEFHSLLKNSRVELIDQAAHLVQRDQREQVSGLVSDFLK